MCAAATEPGAHQGALSRRIIGLYAVTPDFGDTACLIEAVTAALDGGASAIQYRNKAADAKLKREQAGALARLIAIRGKWLIVNDDPNLAVEVDAHGVHIGSEDGAIEVARGIVGPNRLVGVSCYDALERARLAAAAGADYVAFGSFFASKTKPAARRAHPGTLHEARKLDVGVVAIGGITAENAPELRRAGADAVAVISAVFGVREPKEIERAARNIVTALNSASDGVAQP